MREYSRSTPYLAEARDCTDLVMAATPRIKQQRPVLMMENTK